MNRAKLITLFLLGIALLATGVLIGTVRPIGILSLTSSGHRHEAHHDEAHHAEAHHAEAHHDEAHHDEAHHAEAHSHGRAAQPPGDLESGHADVVMLTTSAVEALKLQDVAIHLQDVWRSIRIPASVVEKPGQSAHSLAAPIHGTVERIYTVPGQAVSPGDALLDLRVTDEALSQAQIDLLQVMTRMDVIDEELKRLEPLIQSGSVSGKRKRDLSYERQQKDTERQLHIQELLVRGLDTQQVDAIVKNRELMRQYTVRVTGHAVTDHATTDHAATGHAATDSKAAETEPNYSVEALFVLPGATVKRGDDLCRLAYHPELYLVGSAFENELDQVVEATEQQRAVVATFGTHGAEYRRENLSIEFIDNHVDGKSQTFSFFLPIRNEVVRDHTNAKGVRFRTWRFKPGQRAHLQLPVEEFADHIRLPLSAVVNDGVTDYVFRKLDHHHGPNEVEYQRVAVQVEYQGSEYSVLKHSGSLKVGEKVVANRAYELNLELKSLAGKGGAHHGHSH